MDEVSGDVQMEEDIFSSTIEDDLSSVGFPEDSLSDDGEELFSSENSLVAGSKEKNPPPSYSCGQNLSWTLNGAGTLAIGGEGKMYDFDEYYNNHEPAPWYYESYKIKEIIIYYGVTSIGDDAFVWCSDLTNTSIELPSSITSIGTRAFYGCHITSIIIPDSVTSIGDDAFSECSNLTINGTPGSYAETYAKDNNIPFKNMSEDTQSNLYSLVYPVADLQDCVDIFTNKFVIKINKIGNFSGDGQIYLMKKNGECITTFGELNVTDLENQYSVTNVNDNESIITLYLNSSKLEPNTAYYFLIPNDTILENNGSMDEFTEISLSAYPGVDDPSQLSFTTAKYGYLGFNNPDDDISMLYYYAMFDPILGTMFYIKYHEKKGMCYGMSYIVGAWEKKYVFLKKLAGGNEIFDLKKYERNLFLNYSILDYVKMAQIYQYSFKVANEKEEHKDDIKTLYSSIVDYFNGGDAIIISVRREEVSGEHGNHALFPLKIKSEEKDKVEIYVYDCNHPPYTSSFYGGESYTNILTLFRDNGEFTGFEYNGVCKYNTSITFNVISNYVDARIEAENAIDAATIVAFLVAFPHAAPYDICKRYGLIPIYNSSGESTVDSEDHLYWTETPVLEYTFEDEKPVTLASSSQMISASGNIGDEVKLSMENETATATINTNIESTATITISETNDSNGIDTVELSFSESDEIKVEKSEDGIIVKTDGRIDISSTINAGDQSQTTSVTNVDSDKDEILVVTGDDKITVMERSEGSESFDTVIADSTGEAAITPTPTPIPTQKLDRPSAPKLTNSSSGIKITWKAVPNAKKYCVYRKAGGETFLIGTTKKLYFIDKEVANGKAYVYYIQAVGYKTTDVIYKKSSKSKGTKIVRIVTPSSLKLSSKKKKTVVVSWTRNTKVKGYQVRCSLKKNMAGAKTLTIKKNKIVKKTLTLKSKRVYYFQVRSYKTIGGKKYYSAWSAKNKIKVK